jgi:hypothetical protein
MKLTPYEFDYYVEEDGGFCSTCNDFTIEGNIAQDAEFLTCPECRNRTLEGVYSALHNGHVFVLIEH